MISSFLLESLFVCEMVSTVKDGVKFSRAWTGVACMLFVVRIL